MNETKMLTIAMEKTSFIELIIHFASRIYRSLPTLYAFAGAHVYFCEISRLFLHFVIFCYWYFYAISFSNYIIKWIDRFRSFWFGSHFFSSSSSTSEEVEFFFLLRTYCFHIFSLHTLLVDLVAVPLISQPFTDLSIIFMLTNITCASNI